MKYAMWLVALGVALWWWRRSAGQRGPQAPKQAAGPQEVVACAHCQIHLPQAESVVGQAGRYCTPEHLKLAGDQPRRGP